MATRESWQRVGPLSDISATETGEAQARGQVAAAAPPAPWRQRRWLVLAVLAGIVALLVLLYYGLRAGPNVEPGGLVPLDKPAPDFRVTTLDGRSLALSDLRGKVVVINFWGSWCVPCRDEAGELNASHRRFQGQDVVFVGIAWNDTDEEMRKFVQQYRVPYTIARDSEGTIAVGGYGVTGVPETFFVDRQGRLTQKWIGPITANRLDALIEPLARQP